MDLFAPRHLIVILLIVLLVFGTKKIKTLGADLGAAVRGFKQGMKGEDQPETPALAELPVVKPAGADAATAPGAEAAAQPATRKTA